MHRELDEPFDRKERIAERLLLRAAELWGVEHPDYIDPLVKLMVDVIAFELARLGGRMTQSDGRQLEALAAMMVPGIWDLPRPEHVIMSAQPLEPRTWLKGGDHFYLPIKDKTVTGEETVTDIFFSPLQPVELVGVKLAFKVIENTLFQTVDPDRHLPIPSSIQPRPGGEGIWLALDAPDELRFLDRLSVHVQLPKQVVHLAPLLAQAEWRVHTGEQFVAHPYALETDKEALDDYDGEHFFLRHPERVVLREVAACYRYSLFTLKALGESPYAIRKTKCPPQVAERLSAAQLERLDRPMWWLHIMLPVAFNPQLLEQIQIEFNCFPMLSKRLHSIQHKVLPGRNIVPLRLPDQGAIFYVEDVSDDQGRPIRLGNSSTAVSAPGTYLVHHGNLERLDKTTAAANLAQVIRLVQEESSLFTAFGQDLMMKQLNNLRNDLEAIRKQLGPAAYATVQQRDYLIVDPLPQSRSLEIKYWSVTERSIRNMLHVGMTLMPYKQVTVQPGSSRLRTTLLPGRGAPAGDAKLSAMRYALLTRDRVVSKQDVRLFVLHALGSLATDVRVENGVAISSDPKRGLIRTVDLLIESASSTTLSHEEWTKLLIGIEHQLNEQSVHNSAYRIRLQSASNIVQIN